MMERENGPRVMATLTRARCNREFIEMLVDAGMEGVRINSAHVTPDDIDYMIRSIRDVNPHTVILMDTKGPEIRCTAPAAPINVAEGHGYVLRSGTGPSTDGCINVRVENLHHYLSEGNRVLMDDGALEFTVTDVRGEDICVKALASGVIDGAKTVAVPEVELPALPAVSARDRMNLRAALEAGIDIVAHSFVRSAEDVEALRAEIGAAPVTVFSKIECRQAVENLESIMAASDGLLVARGDLGTAIALCEIPALQHDVIMRCRQCGKPTIVATQIMQSMIVSPVPTRAELSDIALATMQGVDWLLLTGETAQGGHPRECIEMMRATIKASAHMLLPCPQ